MEQCTRCGHDIEIGRFCTNCGHAVDRPVPDDDWRSGTAERPAVRPAPGSPSPTPATPPPAFETPPQARFPLFADELDPSEAPTTLGGLAYDDRPGVSPAPAPHRGRPRRSLLPWLAVAAALTLIAGVGVYLLVGTGDDDPDVASDGTGQSSAPPTDTTSPSAGASDDPSSAPPGSAPPSSIPPGAPRDVASLASATPPDTAAPSRDVKGNAVRYDAFNMLDGEPDTAWRMPGSGAGTEVVLALDRPTELTEVGLVNGYAKTSPGYDGYAANRRILQVEWVFADGTTLAQTLVDGERGLQSVPVDGNVTDTVTLRILDVSRPAKGPSGRNYTAISDVALVGKPV